MYDLIGNNAVESLYEYFDGINDLKIKESALVSDSAAMNDLSTRLFVSKQTEALLTLSQLTMFGWMQLNIYDLYQISYKETYGKRSSEVMTNKFHVFSTQDAIERGLSLDDIKILSDFNRDLSALFEELMVFESKYSDLYTHLDYLYRKHGKKFLEWTKEYMEENYFKPSGFLYMSIVSETLGNEMAVHDFINEHGFTPLSYVQYQIQSKFT